MVVDTATGQRLRADARRNRERILMAARAAFAEEGIDAGMSEIAARAGVGVGTLYRRFPTKEALVEALMVDHMERILEAGEQTIRDAPDPWEAFVRYLRLLVDRKSRDEGLSELFAGRVIVSDEIRALRRRLETQLRELIRQAQESGELRTDIAIGDVGVLLSSICSVPWLHGDRGRQLNERFLAVVVDGLRAPGTRPLPYRPASLPEIERLIAACGQARHEGPRTAS
jgi:AcrR family transcriptional regulator